MKQSVTVQKRLNAVIPRFMIDGYDFNDRRGFVNQRIKLTNGSTLEVVTASQDTLAHASATLDFIWIDEPPPEELYSELLARLMVRYEPGVSALWLTMTPVNRPVGFLVDLCEKGKLSDHRFDITTENCPHLTQQHIDMIGEAYLPHERPQRLHGHWHGETRSRFFDAFDERCVTDRRPKTMAKVGLGIDHGEGVGNQVAVLVAEIEGRVWVLDEYTSTKRTTPEDDAEGILAMLEANHVTPFEIDVAVGDINTMGKAFSGLKVNDALAGAIAKRLKLPRPPFYIQSAHKAAGSVDWGNRILNYGFKRGDITINPRCEYLIKAFSHHTGKNACDLKHGVDATRYIIHRLLAYGHNYHKLRFQ
jgi:phage terminase large subunit-like protein